MPKSIPKPDTSPVPEVSVSGPVLTKEGADTTASGAVGGVVLQFVIFHVQDEMFAVPLAEVQEIIRMPGVVHMPLSPAALEGLANLRGTVLPVVNLRSVLGFPAVDHGDATRVVILDQGRPVGLVVDRMANVVSVEASAIESADSIQSTADTRLLTGMIKGRDGSSMVMILDSTALIKREFADLGSRSAGSIGASPGSTSAGTAADDEDTVASAAADETQLVSFMVAGQEYAFPIEDVQEIVQLPAHIAEVPKTAGHVLGVITLRNRLLPMVSLRAMFGLPAAAATDANKVVVVSLDGGPAVGVVMDSIKGVLRVGRASIDALPPLLAQSRGLDDIQGICRLEEGHRLVSILAAGRMFSPSELEKIDVETMLGDQTEGSVTMTSDSETAAQDTSDEEQFVVFRLHNEEYGVPIGAVQEIVRVPDELTRVPKTPHFIEGVINLRGSVLPVVDQRRRFGLAAAERNDRQRIMVFTVKGLRTGFIVDSVSEVMRIAARYIDGAPKLSPEQQKLIRRVANLEAQKRIILLLDVNQLLNVRELDSLSGGTPQAGSGAAVPARLAAE